jgi:hypothetical protein
MKSVGTGAGSLWFDVVIFVRDSSDGRENQQTRSATP